MKIPVNMMPYRVVHGKQGDRNAVHALCRLYVLDLDVLTGGGKVQQRTAEADESTGDEHGGHDHTLGIDAEADAGVAVLAAGFSSKPKFVFSSRMYTMIATTITMKMPIFAELSGKSFSRPASGGGEPPARGGSGSSHCHRSGRS